MKQLLRTFSEPIVAWISMLAIAVLASIFLDSYFQIIIIFLLINLVLGLSLNLINGVTGQFSLGHAGFMSVGAYTSASLSMNVPMADGFLQIPQFFVFAIFGGLAAAIAGYAVGLPSLRLKGDYLAIVTLGFGEIIRVVFLNTPSVGGAMGLPGIPGPKAITLGGLEISSFFISFFLASFWVLATWTVLCRTRASRQGRALLAVREDEMAAEAMGVNTTSAKVGAFVLSSFFAGVAGSLFAHTTTYLNPSTFNFNKSVDSVIMVVLGGMGSFSGSAIAAVFVTILPELLRSLQEFIKVDLRMVLYSLALILIMLLRPQGLFGKLEFSDLFRFIKNKFKGKKEVS